MAWWREEWIEEVRPWGERLFSLWHKIIFPPGWLTYYPYNKRVVRGLKAFMEEVPREKGVKGLLYDQLRYIADMKVALVEMGEKKAIDLGDWTRSKGYGDLDVLEEALLSMDWMDPSEYLPFFDLFFQRYGRVESVGEKEAEWFKEATREIYEEIRERLGIKAPLDFIPEGSSRYVPDAAIYISQGEFVLYYDKEERKLVPDLTRVLLTLLHEAYHAYTYEKYDFPEPFKYGFAHFQEYLAEISFYDTLRYGDLFPSRFAHLPLFFFDHLAVVKARLLAGAVRVRLYEGDLEGALELAREVTGDPVFSTENRRVLFEAIQREVLGDPDNLDIFPHVPALAEMVMRGIPRFEDAVGPPMLHRAYTRLLDLWDVETTPVEKYYREALDLLSQG